MTHDYLRRLLAFHVLLCATRFTYVVHGARGFEKKVSLLLHEEPENPKCFAEGRKDLTCFWEEDEKRADSADQYSFIYTYQNEPSSKCPLRTHRLKDGKTLYVCQMNQTQMFVQLDIQIKRDGRPLHNRSLLIELTFLLDPPANITLRNTNQLGQINVSWIPPPLKYMDDSMMYEISYAPADSHIMQVEEARATSELILRGLQPATKYKVQVRVKLDGISYSGYWSAWSDPVFIDTLAAEPDPLIVSLSVVISFILLTLSLTMLLSHRRFLIKKVWPTIPSPESKFQGLFNVYGGDFKEWLGHTNGGLWLSTNLFYSEETPSLLEVLSEQPMNSSLQCPPLPPKASRIQGPGQRLEQDIQTKPDSGQPMERGDSTQCEDWTPMSHDHWLMERLRALHQPCLQSSLLESQDTYVTLNSGDEHPQDIPEENLPLEVLFTSREKSECHSDLGSGSGKLSSQSSFEYPNQAWTPKAPGYNFMAVADSGVSMDYSPMSRLDEIGRAPVFTHEYKNEIPLRRAFLMRQHHVQDNY